MLLWLFFSIFLFVNNSNGLCATNPEPKRDPALLIVSYDGFKPEYLKQGITPNLNKFRIEGSSARFLKPVFPTETFVNHFSIATGLYPGNHGVLANKLYDQTIGKLGYSYDLFHYNNATVPIWTANEMAGKHSGCIMWPGSEFEYLGHKCTFTEKFVFNKNWESRVDTAMSWFTNSETPANLVVLYLEQPDANEEGYGPQSPEALEMVQKADNLSRYIQEKLVENNLQDHVNVIHLSDHGMKSIMIDKIINLNNLLASESFDVYGQSPVLQIVPKDPKKENEIFTNLTRAAKSNGNFRVYNQQNLPQRWHLGNGRRFGPIIAVAKIGYAFQDFMVTVKTYEDLYHIPLTNTSVYGLHGYDNAECSMNAFFMAKGPLISKNKRLKGINIIDLYNLFCSILKIDCGPNDGSRNPKIWKKLLVSPIGETSNQSELLLNEPVIRAIPGK